MKIVYNAFQTNDIKIRKITKMIGGKLVRSGQNNYATLEQPAGGSANSTIPETGWVNGRVVIGAKGRGRAGSANDAQRSSLGSLMQHNAGR